MTSVLTVAGTTAWMAALKGRCEYQSQDPGSMLVSNFLNSNNVTLTSPVGELYTVGRSTPPFVTVERSDLNTGEYTAGGVVRSEPPRASVGVKALWTGADFSSSTTKDETTLRLAAIPLSYFVEDNIFLNFASGGIGGREQSLMDLMSHHIGQMYQSIHNNMLSFFFRHIEDANVIKDYVNNGTMGSSRTLDQETNVPPEQDWSVDLLSSTTTLEEKGDAIIAQLRNFASKGKVSLQNISDKDFIYVLTPSTMFNKIVRCLRKLGNQVIRIGDENRPGDEYASDFRHFLTFDEFCFVNVMDSYFQTTGTGSTLTWRIYMLPSKSFRMLINPVADNKMVTDGALVPIVQETSGFFRNIMMQTNWLTPEEISILQTKNSANKFFLQYQQRLGNPIPTDFLKTNSLIHFVVTQQPRGGAVSTSFNVAGQDLDIVIMAKSKMGLVRTQPHFIYRINVLQSLVKAP